MPRKKLIRRFEPRYGVSREMVEVEAKYVAREMEDRLLASTVQLQEKRTILRDVWKRADQVLEHAVHSLSERDKLAIQCLVIRDMYHLIELYNAHLKAVLSNGSTESIRAAEPCARGREERSLPFNEWLFEPGT